MPEIVQDLIPTFNGSVSILDLQDNELYKKDFSSKKEMGIFINTYKNSIPYKPIINAAVVPLTNSWQDLLFPTLMRRSLRINRFSLRILSIPFALSLDIITFCFRMVH